MRNLLKKYKPLLIYDGLITGKEFDDSLLKWLSKMGDNQQTRNDFIWSLLNKSLLDTARKCTTEQELYQKHRTIYLFQFRFLNDENKKITKIQSLINECDLRLADLTGLQMNAIFNTRACCEECEKFNRKENSLKDEMQSPTLPIPTCTRERGCFCCYSFKCIRDENGRLIRIRKGFFNK
jgi:hypothetical protein